MAVGDYSIAPFTGPVGTDAVTYQVRGNDNVLRDKFVSHQADDVAHTTSGPAANRPASAGTGSVYVATDTGVAYVYNGSSWVTINSGGTVPWAGELAEVVWGTPGAESGNAIEVSASSQDVTGAALSTSEIGVMVIVTDGAADTEPSATATISAAATPVGTILGGSGTATAVFKTDSSGNFAIRVSETAAASRYIWVRAGGHFQRYVKARDGVLQLTFT